VGSSSLCVEPWQHSCPQQFRTCPTVHRALEGLEAVDLAFGLSVAPGQLDGVVDGIDVSAQDAGEPDDRNEFERLGPKAMPGSKSPSAQSIPRSSLLNWNPWCGSSWKH
jgi:hypothetical protein